MPDPNPGQNGSNHLLNWKSAAGIAGVVASAVGVSAALPPDHLAAFRDIGGFGLAALMLWVGARQMQFLSDRLQSTNDQLDHLTKRTDAQTDRVTTELKQINEKAGCKWCPPEENHEYRPNPKPSTRTRPGA